MTVFNYFNPFSSHFQQSSIEFTSLSRPHRITAIFAGVIGGLLTPFLFFSGAFALFQLTVKWLKKGDDSTADKVNEFVEESKPASLGSKTIEEPVKRSTFSGRGQINLQDGRIYIGEFVEGARCEPQDDETFSYPNGDVFKGSCRDGFFTGRGKFTDETGNVYEGEFKDGEFTGLGKITFATGIVYEGDVVDWKPNGIGTLDFGNGSVLSGQFNLGIKQGKGILSFSDGSEVDVTLEDGKIQY